MKNFKENWPDYLIIVSTTVAGLYFAFGTGEFLKAIAMCLLSFWSSTRAQFKDVEIEFRDLKNNRIPDLENEIFLLRKGLEKQ